MSTVLAPALFDEVEEALKDVVDPELGVNIVDLGLIYDLSWDPENNALIISMTLTMSIAKATPTLRATIKTSSRPTPPTKSGSTASGSVIRFRS